MKNMTKEKRKYMKTWAISTTIFLVMSALLAGATLNFGTNKLESTTTASADVINFEQRINNNYYDTNISDPWFERPIPFNPGDTIEYIFDSDNFGEEEFTLNLTCEQGIKKIYEQEFEIGLYLKYQSSGTYSNPKYDYKWVSIPMHVDEWSIPKQWTAPQIHFQFIDNDTIQLTFTLDSYAMHYISSAYDGSKLNARQTIPIEPIFFIHYNFHDNADGDYTINLYYNQDD